MLDAQPTQVTATEVGFKLRGLRWWIISLIFLATLINYIDRLTISVLAPVITRDLGLTNTEFGGILTWFLTRLHHQPGSFRKALRSSRHQTRLRLLDRTLVNRRDGACIRPRPGQS